LTQQEIIRGCRQGREDAYRVLLDHHADRLMGLCVRYLRDHQKAEDAVQETFIQVFRNVHRFDEAGSLEAWTSRIAINICLKELRRAKRLSFPGEEIGAEVAYDLPDGYEKLKAEDILRLLDQLPEHLRVIFNLHVIEGYNHREIAGMLGIQESLSRTKLTRARKMMQDVYLINGKQSLA
jgi:RNA polymerase sigma-70 factor (ECF subfamily)